MKAEYKGLYEKFGLNVICIDTDASQKDISNAYNAIETEGVSYIITFAGSEDNDNVKAIMKNNTSIKKIELNKLDILSDEQRSNGDNYLTIMRENLELIKKELYQ